MNACHLTGRLTHDVELRQTKGGTDVAVLRIAVNDNPDKPTFVTVEVYGRGASPAAVVAVRDHDGVAEADGALILRPRLDDVVAPTGGNGSPRATSCARSTASRRRREGSREPHPQHDPRVKRSEATFPQLSAPTELQAGALALMNERVPPDHVATSQTLR